MAKSKIDETIKNLASATSKTRSKNLSAVEPGSDASTSSPTAGRDLPGDPNCPHCHGVGYLRAEVPVGHPDFGKLQICVCRHANVTNTVRERLFALSHLDELKDLTFETFKARGRKGLGELQANSLEMAYNQARHYAQSLNGWLLLAGRIWMRKDPSGSCGCELRGRHGGANAFSHRARFARYLALCI